MGLINWIFDIYQHSKIDEARRDAAEARDALREVQRSGGAGTDERVVRALGELALATKTLQRMMVEKGVCRADEFATMLREVDREDGVEDGQSPIL